MKSLVIYILLVLYTFERVMNETVKCPRYCKCYLNITDYMRSVSCISRRLDNIDLAVPTKVQTLDLSNNSISILEDRGFQNLGLVEIVHLNLRHNSIRAVSLHSFAGLVYLKQVDLTGNNLYQILPWTFHENSNLKIVKLSDNPLGHVTVSGPLLDIPSLEVLELRHCSFAYIPEQTFSALPNLRKLNIANNQLINLDLITIRALPNLEELVISKNPWPCNTNLINLKELLKNKMCELIEDSCETSSNEITNNINKQPMLEKIISVGVIYPDFEEVNSNEEFERIEEEDESKEKVLCQCQGEDVTASLNYSSNFLLGPFWLSLVSFQMGVCITLFLGYICMYSAIKKKDYQSLESQSQASSHIDTNILQRNELIQEELSINTSIETFQCPDTPPPSYRDLYSS